MIAEKVKTLFTLSAGLFNDKRPWDEMCQEVAEQCYPLRADFTGSLMMGTSFMNNIMDSTPINSREELGNTIDAMLRQGDWFRISTGDDDRDNDAENARALERGTMLLRRAIDDPRMEFKTATKESDQDYVAFGQVVLSVEENTARDFPRVRAWHPGRCAWTLTDDGDVSAMFRKFTMPLGEVVKKITTGRWNGTISNDLRELAKTDPYKKVKLIHVSIETETVYGDDGLAMRKYARSPYLSIYLCEDSQEVLHERGEPTCPYVVSRWRSMSGHTFGFSPSALNSLGDERMLQVLAMIIMEQGEKALDPPLVGDGATFTRDVNLYSGGFTYIDLPEGKRLQDVMTVVQTGEGLSAGLELKQDARALIIDAWLLNKLYLPSAREMRELEVAVRTEEFRRAALPFFQPIGMDYHPKLLGKIFERMLIMGLIPRDMFPAALMGDTVRFQFSNPLDEAEGKLLLERYNMAVSAIATGAQVDETVSHLFNMKQATLDAVRGVGKPGWIYSGREAKQREEQANQAQQLAQAAQIANQGSLAVANVAGAKQAASAAGLLPSPDAAGQPPMQGQ